nr:ribonuclease H-like domain-containing protein [Tanacetum cinerariifolium]
MEYWITNNDMNIWKVIQNGNNLKRTRRDHDGRAIILPPMTADEHIAVQRESMARTTLLKSVPDDHVADFHYTDDARDIWNVVKARFGGNAESKKIRKSMLKHEFLEFRIGEAEGFHKGYDRMQKILSQLNLLKAKPEDEDINLNFLRVLPSSWSQVALTLKTKDGLELLSFDNLYYKLKTLEVDVKGYTTFSSSQSAGPSHSAFVSTISASKKMSYGDSLSYSSTTTYTAPSNSTTGCHRFVNVIKDVLHSFVADIEPEQQLAYEDFEQIEKLDLEEMDLKWQMAMLFVRVHKFKQKAGRKIDFDKKESARFNKKKEASTAGDAGEFALMGVTSEVYNCPFGRNNKENELGWDDFAFSVFTTTSEDVEGKPLFNGFAKADCMKVVPPPLSGDYTSLSDHIDLDELHMSYGTKSLTSNDSKFESNDFVSYDDSDMSSEVNTNDFASSDSSVKSSEPKPNDSTSCASTSSDYDFYDKQMVNKTVGIGVGPVHSMNQVNHQNQFVSQAVLLRTGKVNIPPTRPQPVPTGKPKVFAPVPSGKQNRPFPVPTDRGYSPSIISGWLQSTARPMPHFSRPTSSYFQTYTPYEPTMYYNHIKYGRDRWATIVEPLADAEDERVFDSGCSRSMTGNKERLDDFQVFQGRKVTFGCDEGRITGKGTIRTPTLNFENVYYVKELQQFNLFSISQIYDKKNRVLFTDTECLVLSKDFQLPDESMVED